MPISWAFGGAVLAAARGETMGFGRLRCGRGWVAGPIRHGNPRARSHILETGCRIAVQARCHRRVPSYRMTRFLYDCRANGGHCSTPLPLVGEAREA